VGVSTAVSCSPCASCGVSVSYSSGSVRNASADYENDLKPADLVDLLVKLWDAKEINNAMVLVGHEPTVSRLVSELTAEIAIG
jgi:phosphohistidine phosphatase SixA